VIAVCGEALIDLVPGSAPGVWQAFSGGSPLNTAVGLARLGTHTGMVVRLAGDAFGRQLREHLLASGVDLRYAARAEENSTLAIVDLRDGQASYTFYVQGTADWQWGPGTLPVLDEDVAALHTGSLSLLLPPGGPALEVFLAQQRGQRVVSIDPNIRPALQPDRDAYVAKVERWVTLADLVKVSADDLEWLYPERQGEQVAAGWARKGGPSLVVLTKGGQGAVGFTAGGERVAVPGEQIQVVDTVGAGDTFSAGLLDAGHRAGWLTTERIGTVEAESLARAMAFATHCAAVACQRAGADPPWRADL
jgi:fructokinase